jgi:beta-phosphoglucomutase-like phosphatase (HAD superfamily)
MSIEITDFKGASKIINKQGREFALVKNPEYVFPEFEIYTLAEKIAKPVERLSAVVMDMDGTTTTTEELCIHSLEFMIRKMGGLISKTEWEGLDAIEDYPNIIGNSTTKHVEFLVNKYKSTFKSELIVKEFIESAKWTIGQGKDVQRKKEVETNLKYFGLNLNEESKSDVASAVRKFSTNDLVKIGIDIYYARYHQILEEIKKGSGHKVSKEIFDDYSKQLISPMPGVLVFLSLVKGWFGDEITSVTDQLLSDYKEKAGIVFNSKNTDQIKNNLLKLSNVFSADALKVGVVTSSIFYEADIVMTEVFKCLTEQVDNLNLSKTKRDFLRDKFSHYNNVYDSFVTASDSSEIRLKPHRDLYSIALHQLGINKDKFNEVAGFEDSESGAVAIRAAGIGLCVAVPFAQTAGHNLNAASYISMGGLPEVILAQNIFLQI